MKLLTFRIYIFLHLLIYYGCENRQHAYKESVCFPIDFNFDPCIIELPGNNIIMSPDQGYTWAFNFKKNPLYKHFELYKNDRNEIFQINTIHEISFAVKDSFIYWQCNKFVLNGIIYNIYISLNHHTDSCESFISKSDFLLKVKERHKSEIRFSSQLYSLQDSTCVFNKNFKY